MGTQGAGGFRIFGSNAAAVAKSSTVPVLVVPKDAQYQGLRHLLLADDLQGVDARSMSVLLTLAQRTGAPITIAHVLRDAATRSDALPLAMIDDLFGEWPFSCTEIREDDVAVALSDTAERQQMDLVAVLHRHTGLLHSLLHSSATRKPALHSRIPLLVLKG